MSQSVLQLEKKQGTGYTVWQGEPRYRDISVTRPQAYSEYYMLPEMMTGTVLWPIPHLPKVQGGFPQPSPHQN